MNLSDPQILLKGSLCLIQSEHPKFRYKFSLNCNPELHSMLQSVMYLINSESITFLSGADSSEHHRWPLLFCLLSKVCLRPRGRFSGWFYHDLWKLLK